MGVRVGIVTMVGNFNYGNRLQNYAVWKIYDALGCDAVTLDYPGRSLASSVRHLAADVLLPREATHPEEAMSTARLDSFRSFTALIPTQAVKCSLRDLAGRFDYFSVGSDQVWNPNYVDSYRWMFLEFAQRRQRVALSPSIGMSALRSPYARAQIARGLRGFDHLSVRELDGARLIKGLTGQDATVVIDPTLMLRADTWRKVANTAVVPHEPYVFTYLLGDRSEEQEAYVRRLAEGAGGRVAALSDKAREGEVDAGPAEFIALIDGASQVVTDSFHAAVFSVLLGTPLTIFRREGRSNLFSRLVTLTETFDLKRAIFVDPAFGGGAVVDDKTLERVLLAERARVAEHLRLSMPDVRTEAIEGGV